MEGGQGDENQEAPEGGQDQAVPHEDSLQPPPKRLCLEYFGALEAPSAETSR